MKNREELNALKEKAESLNKKRAKLTEKALLQVTGGLAPGRRYWYGNEDAGAALFGDER